MPKRKTVKINTELVLEMVYAHSWSAASFSKMIGKHERWLSEVKRGKNLPSPEEAANMCALLNAKPKEILMLKGDSPEETAKCLEDIEAVRKLVEADGIKEAPDPKTEGAKWDNDEDFKEAVALLKKMDKETLRVFVKAARGAVGEQQR